MYRRKKRISERLRKDILESFAAGIAACDLARKYENRKNGANINTICAYYTEFREAIFLHYRKAPRLDGQVEIDETFFGGRQRKKYLHDPTYGDPEFYMTRGNRRVQKKKYKRKKIMVMGILKRGGDVYTHIIERRDADTLIPIIHMVVPEGTTIYTDEWSSYSKLALDGYHHIKINHSRKFARRKGEHVNTLERFWQFAKDIIRPMKGGYRHNFPLHLKEAEFRWNVGEENVLKELKKILRRHGRSI